MNIAKQTKSTYLLEMSEGEVAWLKGLMQNPLNGDLDPSNECLHDKNMREKFWRGLGGDGFETHKNIPTVLDVEGREDYPIISNHCNYYGYQCDSNGEVAISFCSHPDNPTDKEGNCTHTRCPLHQPSEEYS